MIEIRSRYTGRILKTVDADSLVGMDLRGADLREADLCEEDLRGADFCGANLCGANLCEANLRGADFSEADLRRSYLSGADFRGADLSGAYLRGAYLREANMATSQGLIYAECSWSEHGERGRSLLGVIIDGIPTYFCGCFHGTEDDLRDYIADGEEIYKKSRTIAADFVSQRIKEMMEEKDGNE